jgi:hypothetical protein
MRLLIYMGANSHIPVRPSIRTWKKFKQSATAWHRSPRFDSASYRDLRAPRPEREYNTGKRRSIMKNKENAQTRNIIAAVASL